MFSKIRQFITKKRQLTWREQNYASTWAGIRVTRRWPTRCTTGRNIPRRCCKRYECVARAVHSHPTWNTCERSIERPFNDQTFQQPSRCSRECTNRKELLYLCAGTGDGPQPKRIHRPGECLVAIKPPTMTILLLKQNQVAPTEHTGSGRDVIARATYSRPIYIDCEGCISRVCRVCKCIVVPVGRVVLHL